MGTKLDDQTLAKCADDEPIFVLRAQDKCAPATIRTWANKAKDSGTPQEKVDAALAMADLFETWAPRKIPD